MSWFGSAAINIDALIKETCSEAIPNGEIDYNKAFEIIDLIKVKKVKARDFLRSWENKIINNKNPNNQISLLNLVDLCIKNSGINFSLEIFAGGSVPNAGSDNDFSSSYGTIRNQFLNKLLFILHNSKTNSLVKDKVLELIETWHILFSKHSNLNHNINLIYDTLKDENFKFPKIDNKVIFNEKFLESKVPPVWVDSDSCMIGFEPFTVINRKHHCRNCGGVFCQLHSAKSVPIPMMGLNEPVRVCDSCFEQITEKSKTTGHGNGHVVKHGHRQKTASKDYDSDEDELLKKALALSLKESQLNTSTASVNRNISNKGGEAVNSYISEGDEDEQMKAAIAASLKDLEEQKKEQPAVEVQPNAQSSTSAYPIVKTGYPYTPQGVSQQQQQQQQQAPQQPQQSQPSPFDGLLDRELESKITSKEEDSIYLFSQLMNNLKQQQINGQQSANEIVQNQELQGLYTEIIKLKTKLGRNINEDLGKYEQFIDLQQKLGTIVRLYDSLLEKRLSLRGYNRNSYGGSIQSSGQQYPYSTIPPNYSGIQPSYTGYAPPQQPLSFTVPNQSTGNISAQPTAQIPPQFTHDPYKEASESSQISKNQTQYPQHSQPSLNLGPTETGISEPQTGEPQSRSVLPSEPQSSDLPSAPSEPSAPSVPPVASAPPVPTDPSAPSAPSASSATNQLSYNTPQGQVSPQQTSSNYANLFPSAPTADLKDQNTHKEEALLIEL